MKTITTPTCIKIKAIVELDIQTQNMSAEEALHYAQKKVRDITPFDTTEIVDIELKHS